MKRFTTTLGSVVGVMGLAMMGVWAISTPQASAHCQVPCGIYDDAARITRLKEDTATIRKAVDQINKLGGAHDVTSINQATRWIMTKEEHASHIIEVVSQYFLTQKVKPVAAGADGYDGYLKKLADHHAVMSAAMKTKQTVDMGNVDALAAAIDALAKHYR